MFVLVLVIAMLLFSLIRLRRHDYEGLANHMADRSRQGLRILKPCPLCDTLLNPGERVHTIVFSGDARAGVAGQETGNTRKRRDSPEDALVHMNGCPYCRPPDGTKPRICPVCRKKLPADGFVIARMFVRESRKHVHVLGCTECRRSKSHGTAGNSE